MEARIAEFWRHGIDLGGFPTPLQEMPHLTKALGGPTLLIKRDDMTDIAFGGNKARKLRLLMADAQEKGADVIISTGGLQSNSACMVAAAARRLQMKPILVLQGSPPKEYDGNLLLEMLLRADIRFVETEGRNIPAIMNNIANELIDEGHKPYVIPLGASTPLGSIGYASAMLELRDQTKEMHEEIDYIVSACGTGGTLAGLILGTKALNTKNEVLGISVGPDKVSFANHIAQLVEDASRLLSVSLSTPPCEINVFDEYVGEGYGVVTKPVAEAIRLVAEKEGIILDPVYTGKAMAGLIDLINKNHFSKEDTVVFLHTGGLPALFPYRNVLREALQVQ